MKGGDRVIVPATLERGKIVKKIPKADGVWAEQFYTINFDNTPDWHEVTLQEQALAPEPKANSKDKTE